MTYSKEAYHWKKEHGICVDCGSAEATHGTRCAVCALKQSERAMKKHHSMTAEERQERNRKRREKARTLIKYRRENGLCAWCGKPVYDGHAYCMEHYLYHKKYKKNKQDESKKGYRELGLCRICGKEPVPGNKMCAEHLEQYRGIMARNAHTVNKDGGNDE